MSIRPGRFLSIAIVVVWGVLVGVHISRSYARRGATELIDFSASASAPDAELTQRGVFYRGARIGFIRERVTPLEDGYRVEQTGDLTLTVLGRERRMRIEGSAETGTTGELRGFSFRLSTSSQQSLFETTVFGTVEGDELVLNISSPRSERTERWPLDEPIVLPLNLYYSLAAHGWTTGKSYRVRLFDPMTLTEEEAIIDVKELEIVRWGRTRRRSLPTANDVRRTHHHRVGQRKRRSASRRNTARVDASQRSTGEQPSSPKRVCASCSRRDAAIGDTGSRLRRRRVEAFIGKAEARQLSRWP